MPTSHPKDQGLKLGEVGGRWGGGLEISGFTGPDKFFRESFCLCFALWPSLC